METAVGWLIVTTHPVGRSPHGQSVQEASLAGMPKSSLQGRIHGIFRNRLSMGYEWLPLIMVLVKA